MRKLQREMVDTEVQKDIMCNCCGRSCRCEDAPGTLVVYESATLSASWGYWSGMDGDQWHCDLCEDCAKKIKAFIESLGGKVEVHSSF